jgi:hypothetical protein
MIPSVGRIKMGARRAKITPPPPILQDRTEVKIERRCAHVS